MHTRIVSGHQGFTWLESVITTGAVVVLLVVAGTGMASSRNRSQRLVCMDNLRQIGQGLELWAFEHGDAVPWLVYRSEGGTRPEIGTKIASASFEFAAASNELRTPKILLCPNDTRTKAAQNWGLSSDGGYLNSAYRDNATSYTISLHSVIWSPRAVMSSDRHLSVDSNSGSCSFGVANIPTLNLGLPSSSRPSWTNALHGYVGNVLLRDGTVAEVPNSTLPSVWQGENQMPNDNGSGHLIIP